MPNLNGSLFLEKAINSFIQQDFHNKELFIVDGKSTDKSHEIISSYKNKEIKWIKYEDKGLSDAFNYGLQFASGNYIGFFASDVFLSKNILSDIAYYAQFIDFDLIYFDSYQYLYEKDEILYRKCPDVSYSRNNLIRYGTLFGGESFYLKKEFYDKLQWNINVKYCQDYEFLLRLSKYNPSTFYLNKAATINVYSRYNLSSINSSEQFTEAQKIARQFNINNLPSYYDINISIANRICNKLRRILNYFNKKQND